jgi:hypothetical protein
MVLKNTLKNANSVLRCLATHLRVGMLAKRELRSASCAVLHSPVLSSVALELPPNRSSCALT